MGNPTQPNDYLISLKSAEKSNVHSHLIKLSQRLEPVRTHPLHLDRFRSSQPPLHHHALQHPSHNYLLDQLLHHLLLLAVHVQRSLPKRKTLPAQHHRLIIPLKLSQLLDEPRTILVCLDIKALER